MGSLKSNLQALYGSTSALALSPRYSRPLSWLLIVLDGLLSGLIIRRIPYTEIDWVAYMQQIAKYRAGERDYSKIYGQTGPLVYGASHVYIYNALYALTDEGRDIFKAQCLFLVVYIAALGTVMACYRRAKAPSYIFVLLILSKRLHSIFLLRLFNDAFAVLAFFLSVYFLQTRLYAFGSLFFSFGLGMKLPLALAGPAVLCVLFQALPPGRALNSLNLMLQSQILLGYPFWMVNGKEYLGRAFDLGRQFLFKWTVNWRFVGEAVFLSQEFAITLLVANAFILALFGLNRWLRPSGLSPLGMLKTLFKPLPKDVQQKIHNHVTPDYVLTSSLTSMIIGLLCARSLHYQFFAYIAWSTPFLLWRSGMPPYLVVSIWAVQEWAWNVYPSTSISSAAVVGCLSAQIIGVWYGTRHAFIDVQPSMRTEDTNLHDHTE